MSTLLEAIDVWKRLSEKEVVRYRCFKNLSTERYSVQSADFYKSPHDLKRATHLDGQHLELLAEQFPDDRAGSYDSLVEAIEAHDRDFEEPAAQSRRVAKRRR